MDFFHLGRGNNFMQIEFLSIVNLNINQEWQIFFFPFFVFFQASIAITVKKVPIYILQYISEVIREKMLFGFYESSKDIIIFALQIRL